MNQDWITDPNDISAFANMVRDAFPDVIDQGSGGSVAQRTDESLVTYIAEAFQIYLSNGASYQITIKQVIQAEESEFNCMNCYELFERCVLEPDGFCPACRDEVAS